MASLRLSPRPHHEVLNSHRDGFKANGLNISWHAVPTLKKRLLGSILSLHHQLTKRVGVLAREPYRFWLIRPGAFLRCESTSFSGDFYQNAFDIELLGKSLLMGNEKHFFLVFFLFFSMTLCRLRGEGRGANKRGTLATLTRVVTQFGCLIPLVFVNRVSAMMELLWWLLVLIEIERRRLIESRFQLVATVCARTNDCCTPIRSWSGRERFKVKWCVQQIIITIIGQQHDDVSLDYILLYASTFNQTRMSRVESCQESSFPRQLPSFIINFHQIASRLRLIHSRALHSQRL